MALLKPSAPCLWQDIIASGHTLQVNDDQSQTDCKLSSVEILSEGTTALTDKETS